MQRRINTSIIGTAGANPAYWPDRVFASEATQRVVLALAEAPRCNDELAEMVPGGRPSLDEAIAQLLDLQAVERRADGRLALSFSLLTCKDLDLLDELIPPFGKDLARCVLRRADEIDRVLAELSDNVSSQRRAESAFAAVGCFGLDWAGISELQRAGYLSPAPVYPDGGRFVLIAEEQRDAKKIKDYCGSHTGGGTRYAFTNFGDHSGPRHALPDLLFKASWAVGSYEWPGDLREAMTGVTQSLWDRVYDELGGILAGEAAPRDACVKLLELTGYVVDGVCQVPFFTMAMANPLLRVVSAATTAVREWAQEAVPQIDRTLSSITPFRQGVDRGHVLNHLWHFIFADANRVLAESGFMLDPPPGPEGQGRYLPWVAEQALYQRLWSAI